MLGSMGRDYDEFTQDIPITNSRLLGLEEFWASTRPAHSLPTRSQLDATVLLPWLAHVALVDVVKEPMRFRIRHMGKGCVSCVGGDYTGRWIDECVDGQERAKVLKPYIECVTTGEPVKSNAIYVVPGKLRTLVHRLYLPCADDGKTVDRIVVGLLGIEDAGRYYAKKPASLHLK